MKFSEFLTLATHILQDLKEKPKPATDAQVIDLAIAGYNKLREECPEFTANFLEGSKVVIDFLRTATQ